MKKSVALALLGFQGDDPTAAQINEAYRTAMLMSHPDRFTTNEKLRKHAEEQCKLINEARDVLLNNTWEHEESSSKKESGYKPPQRNETKATPTSDASYSGGRKEYNVYEREPARAPEKTAWNPAPTQKKKAKGTLANRIVIVVILAFFAYGIIGFLNQSNHSSESNAGNSTSQPSTDQTRLEGIVVRESVFNTDVPGYVDYTFILENPNPQHRAYGMTVEVIAKDANGAILLTDSQYVPNILAKGRRAVSGIGSVDAEVATMTFKPMNNSAEWIQDDTSDSDMYALYEISDLYEVNDQDEMIITSEGEFTNHDNEVVNLIDITVAFYDEAGALIGSSMTQVSGVSPNEKVPFRVMYLLTASTPSISSCYVFLDVVSTGVH